MGPLVSGLALGAVAVTLDGWLFQSVLGLAWPLVSIVILVIAVLALMGARRAEQPMLAAAAALMVPLGILGMNWARMEVFGSDSALGLVGL